jgi:UMF1 family MFS transporter
MTVIWILICLLALGMQTEAEFYMMAVGVGIVMGGFHLARATYAKLIPENTPDTTSFFSFYDMTDKLSTALGPVSYGLLEVLTGSMRGSIIALVLYFVVGLCFLYFLAVPRGEISSQN